MNTDRFNIPDIISATNRLVGYMETTNDDIGVKIAALKSAAALYEHAVGSQALAQVLANVIKPK